MTSNLKILFRILQDGKIEEYLKEKLKNDYLIAKAINSVKKKIKRGNLRISEILSSYKKYCIEDKGKDLELYKLKEYFANTFPMIFYHAFSENHEYNIARDFICCYSQASILTEILKEIETIQNYDGKRYPKPKIDFEISWKRNIRKIYLQVKNEDKIQWISYYEPFIRLSFSNYPIETFYSSLLQSYSNRVIGSKLFIHKTWEDYLQERVKENFPNTRIPKNYFTRSLLEKEVIKFADSIVKTSVYVDKGGKKYFSSLSFARFLAKNWKDILNAISKIAAIYDTTNNLSKLLSFYPEQRISPEDRRKFLKIFEEMLMSELSWRLQ